MTQTAAEHRAIDRVAAMVDHVADQLDAQPDAPLHRAITECSAAVENYLEAQREHDAEGRSNRMALRHDLRRLAHLLTVVDRADSVVIMRLIRRALGRLDTRPGFDLR